MSPHVGSKQTVEGLLQLSDQQFVNFFSKKNTFVGLGKKRRFKYRTTNESLETWKKMINVNSTGTVLAVSGSGMMLFDLLSEKVAPKIIAFDYSPKQVAYNFFLKSSVRHLTWKEFNTYFNSTTKPIPRIIKRKVELVIKKDVPVQYRGYIPRKHSFRIRDHRINSQNEIHWLHQEKAYDNVRANINNVSFFEYELSHRNLTITRQLQGLKFDVIYLSNVLDWLCWHNPEIADEKPLQAIIRSLSKLSSKNGIITFCHLLSRSSHVNKLIYRLGMVETVHVKIHNYHWLYCKIYGRQYSTNHR